MDKYSELYYLATCSNGNLSILLNLSDDKIRQAKKKGSLEISTPPAKNPATQSMIRRQCAEVLEIIRQHPGHSLAELHRFTEPSLSYGQLQIRIRRLVESGAVEKIRKGGSIPRYIAKGCAA